MLADPDKLPGLNGYFLFDAERGARTSIGRFETSVEADESTRVVANGARDVKLDTAPPNSPKIAVGNVITYRTNGPFTI